MTKDYIRQYLEETISIAQTVSQEEIEKAQKELEYQQKFLQGVRAKLANENFVAHAPAAVIENERKKEADSLSKIASLESKLKSLKK